MWTGVQWGICVLGVTLLTSALISISVFLAFAWKNRELLSQRIQNVFYTKLAVANFISVILCFFQIMFQQLGMIILNDGLRIFVQTRIFITFTTLLTFLELSVCSFLRLFSSQLYMWTSLNIPHTVYNILQAFMIVFIQYLCISNSGIENAHDVKELSNLLYASLLPVAGLILGMIFILHVIVILRSTDIFSNI